MSFSKLQDDIFNLPLDLFQALYNSMGIHKKLTEAQLLLLEKAEKETDEILLGNPLEASSRDSVFNLTNPTKISSGRSIDPNGVLAVIRWALDKNVHTYEGWRDEWLIRNADSNKKEPTRNNFVAVMAREKRYRSIRDMVSLTQKSA